MLQLPICKYFQKISAPPQLSQKIYSLYYRLFSYNPALIFLSLPRQRLYGDIIKNNLLPSLLLLLLLLSQEYLVLLRFPLMS